MLNVLPAPKLQATENSHAPDGFASTTAFNTYFKAKYGHDSYLPYDRDTIPHEPVQMGVNHLLQPAIQDRPVGPMGRPARW